MSVPGAGQRPSGKKGAGVVDVISRGLSVGCIIALMLSLFWLANGADQPLVSMAYIGMAIVLVAERPRPMAAGAALVLGLVIGFVYLHAGKPVGQYVGAGPVAWGSFLGLGSLLVLGARAVAETRRLPSLLLATAMPAMFLILAFALAATVSLHPNVMDPYLYEFDGLLGFQPSFLLGQLFLDWTWLRDIAYLVYSGLPLPMIVLLLLYVRDPQRTPVNIPLLFAVAGVAGYVMYQICPASGPVHLFNSDFPHSLPTGVPLEPVPLESSPRNAMPSLHTTWALLVFWNLQRQKFWVRLSAFAFLFFTVLATMGFGEHYLVDLVVAAPMAVALQRGCAHRWLPAVGGGSLALAWVLYFRFLFPGAVPSSAMAWAMVIGTLLFSAGLWMLDSKRAPVAEQTRSESMSEPLLQGPPALKKMVD